MSTDFVTGNCSWTDPCTVLLLNALELQRILSRTLHSRTLPAVALAAPTTVVRRAWEAVSPAHSRRAFFGRQPLCGTGVTSSIPVTSTWPDAARAAHAAPAPPRVNKIETKQNRNEKRADAAPYGDRSWAAERNTWGTENSALR